MGVNLNPIRFALGTDIDNVIFRCNTASGILGISNLWITEKYEVYSEKPFDVPELEVSIVPSLKGIPYKEVKGVKVTTELRTFQDMLDDASDGYPSQSLLESLSYYYETHNQSFSELEKGLSVSQLDTLNKFKQNAIEYYNE